jgi:hypothetical protein
MEVCLEMYKKNRSYEQKRSVVEAYGPYYLALSEFIDDEGCVMQLKM